MILSIINEINVLFLLKKVLTPKKYKNEEKNNKNEHQLGGHQQQLQTQQKLFYPEIN